MLVRIVALTAALVIFTASQADNSPKTAETHDDPNLNVLMADQKEVLQTFLKENGNIPLEIQLTLSEPPKQVKRKDAERKFSGEWSVRNGILECDGYLTPAEDVEFCSVNIPNDWHSFEFNGNTYYVQPLAANIG